MFQKILASFIALIVSSQIIAQPLGRSCGTMDHLADLIAANPAIQNNMQAVETHTANYLANPKKKRTLVTIPTVFHIVHFNATQNISDAQCIAQLNQLNLDYAHLNTDTNNTPAPFLALAANTNIQFCMAQRDPSGNATTGIERRQITTNTSWTTNDNVKHFALGGLDAWNSSDYLNIWVCNLGSGLLGYAQFPGGGLASEDGVVVLYTTVGSMLSPGTNASYGLGRTATHEVGHWLNMYHIWGDDGTACSGSDQVNDTPNQAGNNFGCPTYPLLDACATSAPGAMFMNYMDYVDDNCMNMFTAGQGARMAALFATGGARVSLLTSQGCVPVVTAQCTGVPPAGTLTSTKDTFCNGGTATLTCNGAYSGLGGITFQWQTSTNGGITWANATGTSTNSAYVASSIVGVIQYQCIVTCTNSSQSILVGPYTLYGYGISSVDNDTACLAGTMNLVANGFGPINWYATSTSNTVINTGSNFSVTLSGDTTFFVNSVGATTNYSVGPVNNTFSASTSSAGLTNGETFRVFSDCTIDTVFAYPNSAGNIKVNLVDSATNAIISSITIAVTAAQVNTKVAIPVSFNCTAGTTYEMSASGSTVTGLFRNNTGAVYPYSLAGILSIVHTITNQAGRYYFFYDWKLHTGCATPRIPVNVHIANLNMSIANGAICGSGSSTTMNTIVTGGSNPITYTLNGTTSNTTGIFTNITPNTYTISVIDANGCTSSSITSVSQSPAILSSAASSGVTCFGNCNAIITVNASAGSGGFMYNVNNGTNQTANSFTNICPGTYTVNITDANGCTESNIVNVIEPPLMNTQIVNQNIPCYGNTNGSTTITNSGGITPYTYSFNNSAFTTTNTYSGLATGVYTVVCADANNCQQTYTITFLQPDSITITPTITPVTNFNNGTILITATGGTPLYSYRLNGGAYQFGNFFSGLVPGIYVIDVKDSKECVKSMTVSVNAPLGIETESLYDIINVSPNPSNGDIVIHIDGKKYIGAISLKLFNSLGQIITEQTLQVNGTSYKKLIKFDEVARGHYMLLLTDDNNRSYVSKLIFKEK